MFFIVGVRNFSILRLSLCFEILILNWPNHCTEETQSLTDDWLADWLTDRKYVYPMPPWKHTLPIHTKKKKKPATFFLPYISFLFCYPKILTLAHPIHLHSSINPPINQSARSSIRPSTHQFMICPIHLVVRSVRLRLQICQFRPPTWVSNGEALYLYRCWSNRMVQNKGKSPKVGTILIGSFC